MHAAVGLVRLRVGARGHSRRGSFPSINTVADRLRESSLDYSNRGVDYRVDRRAGAAHHLCQGQYPRGGWHLKGRRSSRHCSGDLRGSRDSDADAPGWVRLLASGISSDSPPLSASLVSTTHDYLNWLKSPDPVSNYDKAKKDRESGTSEWFLSTPEYQTWKTSQQPTMLWLHGKGKHRLSQIEWFLIPQQRAGGKRFYCM